MKLEYGMPGYRVICAAAVLALSLAACGDRPAGGTATTKIEGAAGATAPGGTAAQKQAEAAKLKAGAEKKAADEKAAADGALASKVKAALAATPGLKQLGVDVHASDGEVTLFGTADKDAQRRTAEKVAAGVPGVIAVKDALQIVRGS